MPSRRRSYQHICISSCAWSQSLCQIILGEIWNRVPVPLPSPAQPVLYWCSRNMSVWSNVSFYLAVLMNLLVCFFYPLEGVHGGQSQVTSSWHWQQACAAPLYSHECFSISLFTTAVNSRWPPAFTFYFLNMRRCLQENVWRQKSSCVHNLCVSTEQKGDQGCLFLLLVTILITTCF